MGKFIKNVTILIFLKDNIVDNVYNHAKNVLIQIFIIWAK
jgi:hypothetical protein